MTMSMDLLGTTARTMEGELVDAKAGINFHFHGEVTLNLTVIRPGQQQLEIEPACSTAETLPETHSANGEQWLMRNHPKFIEYKQQLARELAAVTSTQAMASIDDEDEPPAEPTDTAEAEDSRGWWARRRAAKTAV